MNKKIGKALVVGAGISGIRSALDLAEIGYGVTLIDRAPHPGGILGKLDQQFPSNHCGMCKMLPLVERDAGSQFCLRKGLYHDNIDILTGTELTGVEGEPGRLNVRLRSAPTGVDPGKCVGCGQCADVCPVEVPDAFNEGFTKRKAIYLPVPHSVPNPFVIDMAACNRCGECAAICPTGAIDLSLDLRKQFRILVVDDELVVRDSLSEWLLDEGFHVDMAESGARALEMLHAEPYHLMLTDIKMPEMDGVELLQQAKTLSPELTVVMMTAYATVETAVDAMKIGALDYLMKPFDPARMLPMIMGIYHQMVAGRDMEMEVGALILACGTDYFDPSQGKNPYAYGQIPHVLTHLEFERLLSGCGPSEGRLLRPADRRPVKKIAFLQCVGSRDLEGGSDFCSTACCMIAVKEALLAKDKGGDDVETAIFYMDMRAYGLPYQRFCDQARLDRQVRFERGRVHSIIPDRTSGDPVLRHASLDGKIADETFDLVVLASGQRPAGGTGHLAQLADLSLNPWGFIASTPMSLVRTDHPGVLVAGACTGLKDISESVIQASAAAVEAGKILHAAGGSLAVETASGAAQRDISREPPRTLVAVCTCGSGLADSIAPATIEDRLRRDPSVSAVVFCDRLCTAEGWQGLVGEMGQHQPNRLLVSACRPYAFIPKLKALALESGLSPRLMEAVDLRIHRRAPDHAYGERDRLAILTTALARLKHVDPLAAEGVQVTQKALVVGGGIAGMQAALSIADHGFPVALVEKQDRLGGNLHWLKNTIEGTDLQALLADTVAQVEKHPKIEVHLETRVKDAFGQVGRFISTLKTEGKDPFTASHGAVVLATGGTQAATTSFGYGSHPAIVTQKELEIGLAEAGIDPQKMSAVAMVLCVDSRQEPRNYCSRVCCPTALKQALAIKQTSPQTAVYVLYRDMMTCGFMETYYTRARQAGIIFIPCTVEDKPEINNAGDTLQIRVKDPIIGAPLEIDVDLVVLATGIEPQLPAELAAFYGAHTDSNGFFEPADFKWRPVDALAEGVFGCGIALSPRSVIEAIATAQAAAQRALRILARPQIASDRVVAGVRHSLCSLCERCIEACPYAARTLSPEADRILVNPAMCQGCGACAAACPNSAAVISGFSEKQIFETIDAALAN